MKLEPSDHVFYGPLSVEFFQGSLRFSHPIGIGAHTNIVFNLVNDCSIEVKPLHNWDRKKFTMDKAFSLFSQNLCYPVWLDEDELVFQTKSKKQVLENARGVSAMTFVGSDASVSTAAAQSGFPYPERTRRTTGIEAPGTFSVVAESRESRAERAEGRIARQSGQESGVHDSADLDDVIAKIMKRRDALLQSNLEAEEEIKRLKLENENLKSLNSIGKRNMALQEEQLSSLKIAVAKDRLDHKEAIRVKNARIEKLEKEIGKLRNLTLDAQHALDDGIFWSSSRKDEETITPRKEENRKSSNEENDVLNAVFDWTIGN